MSKKTTSVVWYLNKDHQNSTPEKTSMKWYREMIGLKHTKRYHAGMTVLYGLSDVARMLIDFICEKMNSHNLIENSLLFKEEFNNILQNKKKKSMATIP